VPFHPKEEQGIMANKTQIKGAEPFGKLLSANDYVAAGTIYPGDLVKLKSDGKVEVAAASNASCGVALSYATADQRVLIADDPQQLFVMESDDASIDEQTDLNLNYNITVGTASTLYKRSAMRVDGSTGATDSNLPLKVLRINKSVDNALGDKVDVVCKINNHQLANATEGV